MPFGTYGYETFGKRGVNIFFSRASAERRYREGKTLLDQADRLMAMVHGAKQNAQEDNEKINALMAKAQQLYEQLDRFHTQFANPDTTDFDGKR